MGIPTTLLIALSSLLLVTKGLVNPEPLVIKLNSYEGIGAIIYRISYLYEQLQSNRNVTVYAYSAKHYDHHPRYSFCKFFIMPTNFYCGIGRKDFSDCRVFQNGFHITPADLPDWLETDTCISGLFPYASGIAKEIRFTKYSLSLYNRATELLRLNLSKSVAFHWVRRDEEYMCDGEDGVIPLNCQGVAELLADIPKQSNNKLVYIATNEQNADILRELSNHGYYSSATLRRAFEEAGEELSPMDLIVLDMLIMCKSESFVYYGWSSVDPVVIHCRTNLFS